MIEERRHVRIEAGKDKAAIAFHTRQAEQSLRLREGVGIAAGLAAMGNADERPVIGIDPAVIGALEFPRPASELPAQHRAAMPAAIDQHIQPALLIAADDHRLQADMRGLEVARLGQLALMRDKDPGLLEDALHLAREDGGIAVSARVDPEGVRPLEDERRALAGVEVAVAINAGTVRHADLLR